VTKAGRWRPSAGDGPAPAIEGAGGGSPGFSQSTPHPSGPVAAQSPGAAWHGPAEAAAAHATAPAVPLPFERMLEQMRGEIHAGRNEFKLALDPPEMGRLDVDVVTRGEGIVLRLTAERGDVAQWLKTDLPILHRAFEKDGLQVLGVEVRSWTDLDARAGDGRRGHETFVEDRSPSTSRGARMAVAPPRVKVAGAPASGTLDLFV
jgi:flagellar hook-length control protein FliK